MNAGDMIIRKDRHREERVSSSPRGSRSGDGRPNMASWTRRDVRPVGDPDEKAAQAEVRAIAPSALLELDEARFRLLLARSVTLKDAVRASAEKRGINSTDLFADQ